MNGIQIIPSTTASRCAGPGLPSVGAFASVSAASFEAGSSIATDSLVAGFGLGLAPTQQTASIAVLPTTLDGTQVQIIDTAGACVAAPLIFVAPSQIDYLVPGTLAQGDIVVNVISNGAIVATGSTQIQRISPGIFTANSSGKDAPAAQVRILKKDGSQGFDTTFQPGPVPNTYVPKPIDLSAGRTYVVLYGTGLRGYKGGLTSWKAQVGGQSVPVTFAGAQGTFAGLDQVNIGPLPAMMRGSESGASGVVAITNGLASLITRLGRASQAPWVRRPCRRTPPQTRACSLQCR